MRQVNRDELIYLVQSAMRLLSPSMLNDMKSPNAETTGRARTRAAAIIVDKALAKYEILHDGPLPEVMGEQTFSVPVARMLGDIAPER